MRKRVCALKYWANMDAYVWCLVVTWCFYSKLWVPLRQPDLLYSTVSIAFVSAAPCDDFVRHWHCQQSLISCCDHSYWHKGFRQFLGLWWHTKQAGFGVYFPTQGVAPSIERSDLSLTCDVCHCLERLWGDSCTLVSNCQLLKCMASFAMYGTLTNGMCSRKSSSFLTWFICIHTDHPMNKFIHIFFPFNSTFFCLVELSNQPLPSFQQLTHVQQVSR